MRSFGRRGFKRPASEIKEKRIINISYLDENVKKLSESGFLKKEKDSYVVDLNEKG
jgi:ribosomal protein L15